MSPCFIASKCRSLKSPKQEAFWRSSQIPSEKKCDNFKDGQKPEFCVQPQHKTEDEVWAVDWDRIWWNWESIRDLASIKRQEVCRQNSWKVCILLQQQWTFLWKHLSVSESIIQRHYKHLRNIRRQEIHLHYIGVGCLLFRDTPDWTWLNIWENAMQISLSDCWCSQTSSPRRGRTWKYQTWKHSHGELWTRQSNFEVVGCWRRLPLKS